MLETSHPPNYYFPPDDVLTGALERAKGASFCEWKGRAHYFTVRGGSEVAHEAAWGYEEPSEAFAPIAGYVAFYAGRMDACFVDDELVVPQPGGFYGGWITANVVGPFKGGRAREAGRARRRAGCRVEARPSHELRDEDDEEDVVDGSDADVHGVGVPVAECHTQPASAVRV